MANIGFPWGKGDWSSWAEGEERPCSQKQLLEKQVQALWEADTGSLTSMFHFIQRSRKLTQLGLLKQNKWPTEPRVRIWGECISYTLRNSSTMVLAKLLFLVAQNIYPGGCRGVGIVCESKRLLCFPYIFRFTDIAWNDLCVGIIPNSTTDQLCTGSQDSPGFRADFWLLFILKIFALRGLPYNLGSSEMGWKGCLLDFSPHVDGFSGMVFQITWSSHPLFQLLWPAPHSPVLREVFAGRPHWAATSVHREALRQQWPEDNHRAKAQMIRSIETEKD